jgi:hypothetical protein
MLNSEVIDFTQNQENNKIVSCDIVNKYDQNKTKVNVIGDQFVVALPPKLITNIIKTTSVRDAFGNYKDFDKWAIETNYIPYVSVAFHWDTKLNLAKKYGFPKSDWGVSSIILSDYMTFGERSSKTVISTAVTIIDKKSRYCCKAANDCPNKTEFIEEVFRQLKETYPELSSPTVAIMTPNNYYDNKNKRWESVDTAYLSAHQTGYIPYKSEKYDNLYNVGTHNGNSVYKFTSMESAISNSLNLSLELFPELTEKYKEKYLFTVRDILFLVLITILVIIFIVSELIN